ncbi:MAG: GNAT family N-acetyltransferase [Syntrophales bacterium]|nr:GNAT family N-acetyltransferase [Syntrophales bacterium]
MRAGYLSPTYACALKEFGEPFYLKNSGGWVLERKIPDCKETDAMGCYPLFLCEDWSALTLDFKEINREWVTLSIVADPFGNYTLEDLKTCFPDLVIPFKKHYIIDLQKPLKKYISEHHLRNTRKALNHVNVEVCPNAQNFLNEWLNLYSVLIKRHQISGISAFSDDSFAQQLKVPGLIAFRAFDESETVGMLLWYVNDNRAYYHLGAYSEKGYTLRASFALFWYSINYFRDLGLKWLDLGGGAGLREKPSDGLIRFKQGWSTGTRVAYFCGRIIDRRKYENILQEKKIPSTTFFPAYRVTEFGGTESKNG